MRTLCTRDVQTYWSRFKHHESAGMCMAAVKAESEHQVAANFNFTTKLPGIHFPLSFTVTSAH